MNSSKTHIINSLGKGIRFDSRKPLDYREIKIETNVVNTADGSSRVKIGETEVIAGVKLEIGKPYSDTPDQGSLIIGAEFLPMASPDFESGPPGINAIELARITDRGIRESQAIDTKKLCIKEGEEVWTVVVDICTINAAGNLWDAAPIAVMSALLDTKLPQVKDGMIQYREPRTTKKLPLSDVPVSITVFKIGENFILDPTYEEEKLIDSRLTVAVKEDNTICAMQKGGDIPLELEDISKIVDIVIEKSKELRKLIKPGK